MKDFFKSIFFDEDKGDGASGAGAGTEGAKTDDKKAEEKKADDKTEQPKYTDKQLNDIVTKHVTKETGKILKDFGVASLDELKSKIAGTPAPTTAKETDELKTLKEGYAALEFRANRADAEAAALKAGVAEPEKLARVVKLALADTEGTIEERVGRVLKEVPEFVKTPGQAFGAQSGNQTQDVTETLMNQIRQQNGLPIPGGK